MAEEREIEADVVPDDHRIADEFGQRWQHRADARCRADEGIGQAGEERDLRWDGSAGVDERLERPEELAAAYLDGADFGDLIVGSVATRGLEIEHAERDIAQRNPQFVERTLHPVECVGRHNHVRYLNTNRCTLSNFTVS